MKEQRRTKLVHEGEYVAEVEVRVVDTDDGWSPYLRMEDAYRLDDVRIALKNGDTTTAAKFGKIYRLTPIR